MLAISIKIWYNSIKSDFGESKAMTATANTKSMPVARTFTDGVHNNDAVYPFAQSDIFVQTE